MFRAQRPATWIDGCLSRRSIARLQPGGGGAVGARTTGNPGSRPAAGHPSRFTAYVVTPRSRRVATGAPGAPGPAELDELMRMQAMRGAHANNQIRRWGMGAGVLPWTAATLDLIKRTRRNPVRAGRAVSANL